MSRLALGIVLLFLGALLALRGTGAAWPDAGTVEVRVTDHRAGKGDFSALWVELAEVSVHRAEQPRGTGWGEVVRGAPAVDIVPLKGGRSTRVGGAVLTPGRYDAVRVRFGEVRAARRGGRRSEVVPQGSTVLVELVMERGARRIILIDLYVEDQSEHRAGQYALKIRAVRVERDAPMLRGAE